MMDSKSKRLAGIGYLMSQLPDELMGHILSFLPTVKSVQTIVLSKRLNNIWKTINTLDIDYERDFGEKLYSIVRFAKFVDAAISSRSWSNIQKFRLSCPSMFCYKYDDDDNEEEDGIGYHLPTSGCFSSLKSLSLSLMYQDSPNVEELITYCCPVLEDLELQGQIMLIPHDTSSFNISAPKLKELTVDFQLSSVQGRSTSVIINAPKLERLSVKREPNSTYKLEHPKSLNRAVIDFSNCWSMTKLAELLRGVKDLYIRTAFEKCNLATNFSTLTLNRLELILYHNSYREYLTKFLNKSPNLEYLVLELDNNEDISEQSFTQRKSVPVCLLSKLKKVHMRGFSGRWGELEVLNYLLQYGAVLNELVISSHPTLGHRNQESLYKEILQIYRASKACEVKFM